jgi:Arylsulfotransferase (ASST)
VLKSIVRKPTLLFAATVVAACLAVVAVAGGKSFTTKGAWSFWSAPTLHPPVIHTDIPTVNGKLARGYFMLANTKGLTLPQPMVGQGGPLILDSHLQPVWFTPVVLTVSKQGGTAVGNNATFNLRAQTYQGAPVLTWWQGNLSSAGAIFKGQDVVYNQHYQPVTTLAATAPWVLSPHEFLIQGHDAWVTAYRDVPMDLTKYGGSKSGTLIDSAVQEYDLTTGQMLFSWDALDHIPLSTSHQKPLSNGFWDAYHENSITLGNGTFLVSMRNEWAAYDVNESSGKISWTISGDPKLSTFKLPTAARFHWQHDVELHPGGVLSLFDDDCCGFTPAGKPIQPTGPSSRGLVLKLNLSKHTASLVDQYTRPNAYYVIFLGNTQLVPGGNVVVGWGTGPFAEFTKSGTKLLDAVIPTPDESYRAYLQNWVGLPLTTPSGAVRKSGGKTVVYASWNGATRVVAWRVLAGPSATNLKVVVQHAAKTGFETAITVSTASKSYEVEALAAHGHVIGTSKAFTSSQPTLVGAY